MKLFGLEVKTKVGFRKFPSKKTTQKCSDRC